jgi:hypothetical protein
MPRIRDKPVIAVVAAMPLPLTANAMPNGNGAHGASK